MGSQTDRDVRAKLASRGVETLSDAELLSIIIREGTAGSSAVELAERMLEKCGGSLSELSRCDIGKLRMMEGIGMNRAAVLSAVFEISARLKHQDAVAPSVIRTQEDVVSLMRPVMSRLKHEEMWAIFLTSANGVIEKQKVSQGGVTAMVIDYKLIIKRAIELLASSVIIVHNHPSGMATPSIEDIELTSRLAEAAALLDIRLTDHVIITATGAYSFRQHALLK